MRRAIACLAILLLGERVLLAQVAAPPRDRPNNPSTGTAVIAGHVVDAQTGRAIARAVVRLSSMTTGVSVPSVLTDASGAFGFSNVAAGSYAINVGKSTYLAARYPDAGQSLRASRASLTIGDGERNSDVVVRLQHGGAITGRIVDAGGDPVEFVEVHVFRLPRWGGKLQPRGAMSSDDLGQFRIPRLDAGRYLLLATPQRRGGFMEPPDAPRTTDPEPIPTFFPGVPGIGQATPIVVERGTTVSDIELQLLEGQAAQVSGTLLDAEGQPVRSGGSISVQPVMREIGPGGFGGSGTGVRPDGTFQMRLPPGEYEFEGRMFRPGRMPGGPEPSGIVRLMVAGDLSGITIQLGAGGTISGRLIFEGGRPIPTDANVALPVQFAAADGERCRSARSELKPDWTFRVEGLSGTCIARTMGGIGP